MGDLNLVSISGEAAAAIGTRGGSIPATFTLGQEPWCSPIVFAGQTEVFDFTRRYDANRPLIHPYGIGRYDEDRRGMYESRLFKTGPEPRTIHMGIDIGASVGTPVFAPLDSIVWGSAFLPEEGDYGGTLILKTRHTSRDLYMLFGHLSKLTVARWAAGDRLAKGELLGWLGEKHENGGWNPHLHWQLSWLEPLKTDLPGAVAAPLRAFAKQIFPDPTQLLRVALGGWR